MHSGSILHNAAARKLKNVDVVSFLNVNSTKLLSRLACSVEVHAFMFKRDRKHIYNPQNEKLVGGFDPVKIPTLKLLSQQVKLSKLQVLFLSIKNRSGYC